MRFAFFNTSTKFSGGRLVTFRHANELVARGHDVQIWIEERKPTVEWMTVNAPVRSFSRKALHQIPKADVYIGERARIVRALHQSPLHPVAHFCQGFEGIDTDYRIAALQNKGGIKARLQTWKLRRRQLEIDRVYQLPTLKIVTHPPLAQLMKSRFGQSSHMVPCGIPLDLFKPGERERSGRRVLVVGPTDIGWKRVPDALKAMAQVKGSDPKVELHRIAQHPIREIESQLNVTNVYHSMVSQTEMAELYRDADLLLISSDNTEGFGLPVLEAMACGLPCILTDIEAFRSFDADTDYARFVPVGDVSAMASTVLEILADQPLQERLRKRGLEVARNYGMKRSFDAMEQTLMEMAGAAGRRHTG